MAFNIRSRAGWFRLWVLGSLLWGIASVPIIQLRYPTESGYRDSLEWSLGMIEHGVFSGTRTPEEKNRLKQEAIAEYEENIASIGARRASYYATLAAIWVVPSLLVLALGYLIAWVIRGFRTEP